MAIEIEIPKDITKYEAKLIGPLTTRQTVCVIPGVGLGVLGYNVFQSFATDEASLFVGILFAAPFLLCGWYKPYGIPLEKFIKTVFVSLVRAPKHRKYITHNVYDEITKIDDTIKKEKKTKNNKNLKELKNQKNSENKTTKQSAFVAYK